MIFVWEKASLETKSTKASGHSNLEFVALVILDMKPVVHRFSPASFSSSIFFMRFRDLSFL